MMTLLKVCLFVAVVQLAAASDDATSLVQSKIRSDDFDFNMSIGNGGSNFTPAAAFKMYRVNIYSTHGSDHSCVTELSFMDMFRNQMVARYTHQTSCYGCPISCDGCESGWGNPAAQFDKVTDTDAGTAWSCTAAGTFSGGRGAQTVSFSLKERPAKGTFWSAMADGAWAPKRMSMQEQQTDGTWRTVAMVAALGQGLEESFYIQAAGSMEDPAKWPIDEDYCGSNEKSIAGTTGVADVVPDNEPPKFQYAFTALTDRQLSANSNYGFKNGISMDGDFGTVSLAAGTFEVRQLTLNFPSNFRLNGDLAEGELHLIVQMQGAPGLFDAAVIVILLQLPVEGTDASATEQFLIDMGLLNLPAKSSSKTIKNAIDLNVFSEQLAGGASTLDCSPSGIKWYVLTTPAFVSGTVVDAFKKGPPEKKIEEKRKFEDVTGTYDDFVEQFGDVAAIENWEEAEAYEEPVELPECATSKFGCCNATSEHIATVAADGPDQAGCDAALARHLREIGAAVNNRL